MFENVARYNHRVPKFAVKSIFKRVWRNDNDRRLGLGGKIAGRRG